MPRQHTCLNDMHLELRKTVLTVGAIALVTLPITPNRSQAQSYSANQPNIRSDRSLTGQWVMASIDPDPKEQQKNGKYGITVTQNGNQVRIQPQRGLSLIGQRLGQQVRVRFSQSQYILGDISNDANRVLITPSGSNQPTGILVRVGSSGCPDRGNWNSTISSCSISQ